MELSAGVSVPVVEAGDEASGASEVLEASLLVRITLHLRNSDLPVSVSIHCRLTDHKVKIKRVSLYQSLHYTHQHHVLPQQYQAECVAQCYIHIVWEQLGNQFYQSVKN